METLINPSAAAPDVVSDATTASFMSDVVEASRTTPVIVDLWAPWCGPCRQLGPVLEKVTREAGGAVRLVKVDIDQNPEIAQSLRVQSIPAVFAFRDGQPVDGFAGAVPESQVREFVARLAGGAGATSPIDELLEQAGEMAAGGNHRGAAGLYNQILAHAPGETRALAGLATCLVETGDTERAREMIAGLDDEQQRDPEIVRVLARIDLADAGAEAGDAAALRRRLQANPDDLEARYDLAMALYGAHDREGAVDQLLESIRIDRNHNDEAARKQLIKLFGVFGHSDPLTVSARKRLSSILFS